MLFTSGYSAFGQQSVPIGVDLTDLPDTAVTITGQGRNGNWCADNNCIVFNIKVNPGSDLINFNAGQITGASFYTVNCGPLIPIGTPACITGLTSVQISFCKPGNNIVEYYITATRTVKASGDLNLRQTCSGTMSVIGLNPASITWNSIFPGTQGAYNSYLNAPTGSATVTVTPQIGAPAYIDYRVTGSPNTNCPGALSDTVRVYTYPPLVVNISPSSPVICSGASVSVTASPSGGLPNYTYAWNTGATTPSISVTTPGTYTVSVTDQLSGCPPTVQQVTVGAAATPAAPTASGTTICSGSSATLTATAPGGTYRWYDAASGGTLLFTGGSFTTPVLTANTTYYVETLLGCVSSRTPVTVSVTPLPAAPTAAGATICPGGTASLNATAPGGTYQWYDSASGGTLLFTGSNFNTPALTANTTYYVQTTIAGCPGPRTAVTVTVTPPPAAPTAAGTSTCSGTSATLTASAPGGTYQWYDAPSGGSLLATSASFITPNLAVNTTYYVQTTVNGCPGPRTAVLVTINPPPAAPTASNTTICSGSTATLTATAPGGTYRWYDAPSGGNLMATGTNFTTPVLTANTTYYVETLLGCLSLRTPVTVSVTPLPAAPTASGTTICAGSTGTLLATGPGGTYQWYDASSGGTLLSTGAAFTSPVLTATTTYYVQATVNGCPGPRTATTITVTPLPAAPTAAGVTICAGNSTTLNATAPGGTYQWYDAASGGNLLQTGSSYTTPVLNTNATYYVQTTVAGCSSTRTAVTVNIMPIINPEFKYLSGTYCKSGGGFTDRPIVYTPGGGTFSGSSPDLVIDPITGVIDIAATPTNTYTVTFTNATSCSRASTALITITNSPDARFSYATAEFCVGSANAVPSFPLGASAGVFSSSSTDLKFISESTGEIDLSASSPGSYRITNTITAAGCPTVTEFFDVIIKQAPAAPTFSGITTICAGSNTTITANVAGATLYEWFTVQSGGVPFLSTGSASYTTPNLSATITYYVQGTVNGCAGPRAPLTVYVNPVPTAPTASGASICQGSSATLVATGPGGSYEWFNVAVGGSSLQTGPIYTTQALSSNTTFYVQTTVNGCSSARTAVEVTVTPTPAAPTAPGTTICIGNTATLTASTAGGTYRWYDASSGGNLLFTGAAYTTPTLNTTTNYFVESSINGCPGPRMTITVTVNPPPTAPIASGTTVCSGSSAILTATSPGGTYRWYDAPTGGNQLGTGSPFTTPIVTSNTTFYVETLLGCLSPRTAVFVSVTPLPAAPSAAGTSICSGATATLTATAPGGTYQWYDAASGGTLLATAASFTSPILTTSTTYYVQTIVNSCPGPRTAVPVNVMPLPSAPVVAGTTICIGTTTTLTATGPGGDYRWYDAPSGGNLLATSSSYTTPTLTFNTTYYVETMLGCLSPRTAVNVTVNPRPAAPSASGTTICSGSNATLIAVAPGGTYQWFDAATGGNLLVTSASFTSPVLTTSTTYYVQTTINGCEGPRTAVLVTVSPIPQAPTVSGHAICAGTSTTLTASGPGGNYEWYDAAQGGNLIQTGDSFTTPILNANTNYYIQTTINGCTSARTSVTVATIPITNPEFEFSSGTYCKSGPSITPAPLIFTPGGGTFSASPGLVFANTATGEINVAATPLGTYTITFTNNSQCPRASSVNITITNTPNASFSYNSNNFCIGSNNVLPIFPAGASAGVFSSTPGLVFISKSTGEINLAASSPGTYLVTNNIAASGGCAAATANFSITINPSPSAPAVAGVTICAGLSTTISASGSGGIYQWFDAASGGNLVNTGSVFVTPVMKITTTYFVQVTVNGCTSPRSAAVVNVNPVIDPEFQYSSGTYCKSGTTVTPPPSIYTIGGGTFSSSNGLVFKNRNTGEIDVTASALGTYTISFTNNSPCPRVTFAKVTITNTPDASFSFTGSFCPGGINPLPEFKGGASAGIFSSPSPALVFVSVSTGEIDLQQSSPGTYIITNTIAANGGCIAVAYTSTITISPVPPIPSVSNTSVCMGSSTIITIDDPGISYQWFDSSVGGQMIGTGNFFTTPALSSTTKYYVQAINGICASPRKEVVVTVNPIPVASVLISNSPVCAGNAIVMGAIYVPGATYNWKGPDNFFSGLQNPIINSATARSAGTYILFITVDGCSSTVASIEVKINELPIAIAGTDQTLCASTNAVNLNGTVQGSSKSGIWKSSGTGTFTPSNTSLNTIYIPSNADKAAMKVVLTLTSDNNQSCAPSVSDMTVNFAPLPVVNAGSDQAVCAGAPAVKLAGVITGATGGVWTTTGDGKFTDSGTQLQGTYMPGKADIKSGKVTLTLTSTGNGLCTAIKDDIIVIINPLPVVSAGKDKAILLDETVTLEGTSNAVEAQYIWSPAVELDNYTISNPVFSGKSSQNYTLTVINEMGCASSDEVSVTVLEPIKIPNTFTPNGDGANDLWNIAKLADYPDAEVNVYNRYGVKLFYSKGYDNPWDGTFNGTKVPTGTYYYVIDTKFPGQIFSGYILLLQ